MRQYALSKNQDAILRAVVNAEEERGYALIEHFYEAVFEIPWGHAGRRCGERTTPITPSQRASISRSIRRLEEDGLIERVDGDLWNLTAKGRKHLRSEGVECPKPGKDAGIKALAALESKLGKIL